MTKASEVLDHEFMQPKKWTAKDLADASELPLYTCERLIAGTIPINRQAAKGLSMAFGNTAEFWLNLQKATPGNYDDPLWMEFDEMEELMRQTANNLARLNAGQEHMHNQLGSNRALEAMRREMDEARRGWVSSNC